MANSNETPPKSPVQTDDKNPQLTKPALKDPSPKPSLFCAPALTMAIALIALAFALFAIYTNHHAQLLKDQQAESFNQAVAKLAKQQEANETSLDTLETSVNESQTTLQNRMQALDKNLQTAAQQRPSQQQDWPLLKARYFLELAQINAHWSKDKQTTISLLQQADDLLATTSNQQLFAVRQAIAKEISQLQALPQLDIPGLLSQLDAAQSTLASLPFKKAITSGMNSKSAEKTKSWQENLKNSLGGLEKLVVIRHSDETMQPLLSPFAQTLLRDSIYLNLQEAQWAIMQTNPEVYQLALTRALETIQRVFDVNSAATQALIKQLKNLQQENLRTPNAKLEKSLSLLNQLIEKNNTRPMNNSTTPQGGITP